jgi:exosortase
MATSGVQEQLISQTPDFSKTRSRRIFLWVQTAIITGLLAVLFGSVMVDMFNDWWNVPAYSQGMLLPPLAIYVAWLSRDMTLAQPAAADYRGLLLTAVACLMFITGRLASEFFLTRISFVIVIAGILWTYWGAPRLRTLGFPLLLLATMVPLPTTVYNLLAAPLQLLASSVAAQIAQACGVSVFRDGNVLELAGISLGVVEACSGLNSLSALIIGSVLLGYLVCDRFPSRMLLFLLAAPLAVAVNIVRVAGTALLADWNQEFALGFYHSFSGWLVFVAGFGLLFLLARILHVALERR